MKNLRSTTRRWRCRETRTARLKARRPTIISERWKASSSLGSESGKKEEIRGHLNVGKLCRVILVRVWLVTKPQEPVIIDLFSLSIAYIKWKGSHIASTKYVNFNYILNNHLNLS